MKKLLTTTALAVSLYVGAAFPAFAETVVGTVKFWQYMQADGWKSADGMDNDTLNNTLYRASVIGNYPSTKQFLLRQRGGGAYFLADKKTHTVRKLNLKPASGYYSDLTSVYQGEDEGKGVTSLSSTPSISWSWLMNLTASRCLLHFRKTVSTNSSRLPRRQAFCLRAEIAAVGSPTESG